VPRGVRAVVAVLVVVLGYGGVVHVVQLAGGGYPWAPPWLAAYFVSLTLFDPLAAVLLWARRASGWYLAVLVLVTDAVANGYATYVLPMGSPAARVAQAVISVLALGALAATGHVRPWLR
jgi:hypothetical protein